jgi:signal transduction histidine kinase
MTDRVAAADPAETADAALVRRVRWRLVAWSGSSTLVLLVLLGAALYAAVAGSLAASGTAQLQARADDVRRFIEGPQRPPDGPPVGPNFGGRNSGTLAMLIGPNGRLVGAEFRLPTGLPDREAAAAARVTGHDVRLGEIADGDDTTPIRLLSETVESDAGTLVVQVVQDRTAEERTLQVTRLVLLVGGLVVLVVAIGFGALYARRALGPIRDSLAAQREALRRQREFAANASHELRTPLTVIRGSVDFLRRHRDAPVAEVEGTLDDIAAEATQLTTLVEDLLLLARSDSGAVTLERLPVDLGDVAADAASSLSTLAIEREVRMIVDPEPATVTGDAARLRQLVVILVDNAIRHSPTGGEVSVRVRTDGQTGWLTVEDQGPGVRAEDVPHLFDRFYRAPDAPPGGSGLGLSIASWISERHGGRIDVTNRPEGGARFTVRIPVAIPGVPARSAAQAPTNLSAGSQETTLE